MPLTVSIAVMSMGVSAKAVERFGALNTLAAGLAGIIAGLLLLATQGVHASYFPGLFFAFLLLGLGAGASFLPLLTMGMADAPPRDAGLASGIINVSVQLFGAIGLASLGTVATDHTKALSASGHSLSSALTGGYHLAYVVAAMCVAFGILAAFLVLRPPAHGAAGGRGARARARPPERQRAGRRAARLSPPPVAHPPGAAGGYRARSAARLILPLAVFGSSSANVDDPRVLVGRGLALDVLLQLARELGRGAYSPSRSTTTARTTAPRSSSGAATAAASATAGWATSADSTSNGPIR